MSELGANETVPTKVCGKCSVQSQTAGEFCPHCGHSYTRRGPSKRTKLIVGVLVAVLVIAAGGTALALKMRHDSAVEADQAAHAAAERRAEAVADAEAAAETAAEEQRQARVEAKQAAERLEKATRHSIVRQMQASVTKDAKERVQDGVLEGPIFYTTCDPLGGGSTDDLTALTTTFECLAINKKNDDGTVEGWVFSATANWNEGSWSWHLGR